MVGEDQNQRRNDRLDEGHGIGLSVRTLWQGQQASGHPLTSTCGNQNFENYLPQQDHARRKSRRTPTIIAAALPQKTKRRGGHWTGPARTWPACALPGCGCCAPLESAAALPDRVEVGRVRRQRVSSLRFQGR